MVSGLANWDDMGTGTLNGRFGTSEGDTHFSTSTSILMQADSQSFSPLSGGMYTPAAGTDVRLDVSGVTSPSFTVGAVLRIGIIGVYPST